MADQDKIKKLRVKFDKVVQDMGILAEEATERAGGDATRWSDEDKTAYDAMVAEMGATHQEIDNLEAEVRSEQLREARRVNEKPSLLRAPLGTSKDPLYSRSLEMMSPGEREQVKPMYWRALGCLTSARFKNALAIYQGLNPSHDGSQLAQRWGVPRDIIERFHAGPSEQHRLSESGAAGTGPELVPEDFQAELSRDLAGYASVIRAGATVRPTNSSVAVYPSFSSNAGSYPKQYSTGFAGQFTGEGANLSGGTAPTVQNQPATQQIKIPVHLWAPDAIEITRELLEDTPVALEDEIRQVIVETRGMDYDYTFLKGTGAGEPEGVLNSGATSVTYTSTDVGTEWNSLVNLYTDLPQQYRDDPTAGFIMSSGFLGVMLKLKSTTNNFPFFVVSASAPIGAVPMTLWGKAIYISEFLDATITTGDQPCLWGAWRHFRVVERRDLAIQRLVERYVPNIGLFATARVGGKVMRPAAFRILTAA